MWEDGPGLLIPLSAGPTGWQSPGMGGLVMDTVEQCNSYLVLDVSLLGLLLSVE